jgi:hypothetical protein
MDPPLIKYYVIFDLSKLATSPPVGNLELTSYHTIKALITRLFGALIESIIGKDVYIYSNNNISTSLN